MTTPPPPFSRLAGLHLEGLLSAPLFRAEYRCGADGGGLSRTFHALWTDLADALASCPNTPEVLLRFSIDRGSQPWGRGQAQFSVFAVGRGHTVELAEADARTGLQSVEVLVRTILRFGRFREIATSDCDPCAGSSCLEIRRRRVSFGVLSDPPSLPLGFLAPMEDDGIAATSTVSHLFPWVPSDDSWSRLATILGCESGPAAILVHARGVPMAPASAIEKARADALAIETIERRIGAGDGHPFLLGQLGQLRRLANDRLASFYHKVLAMRAYLVTPSAPSAALLATLSGSIDDPSAGESAPHATSPFRGGMRTIPCSMDDILREPPGVEPDLLFTPQEATAIFRGPMPTDSEIPGIPLIHSRTLGFSGQPGGDVALGINLHESASVPVLVSPELRFRHTYVIGQTGTGKSTLLLNMMLDDARRGRGIALIDPHGSLVEDVLARLPEERRDDVILFDLTDREQPIGFNPLYLLETDADRYKSSRDLLIDGIYSHVRKAYSETPEGFGPVFETHFRMMMSLLLGSEPPAAPLIPNLLMMRRLYADRAVRRALIERTDDTDFAVRDAISEALRTTDDASWENVAPYITSKFSRFIADRVLRNVICQSRTIDFLDIVQGRKILLVNLGRGRIGDFPAGLVAARLLDGLHQAVVGCGTGPSNPGFYFYADEFQIFADSRFADLLAEARKYRLSLTLAHQHLDQLPPDVRAAVHGNCGTFVTFRVGSVDAAFLAEQRFRPHVEALDLAGLDNHMAYVHGSGTLGMRPFSVQTSPPPAVLDPNAAEKTRETSRNRWGRPIAEVEAEIRETIDAYTALGEMRMGLSKSERNPVT